MSLKKHLFWASTALATSLMLASTAAAQSTASQDIDDANAASEDASEVEQVVVTGSRGPREIDGYRSESAPKARVTIGQELIETQVAGQTIFDTLNQVPGLNFTNTDPYGNSGGNVRLRGFDGNRIALSFDGIPLNDTGNYAIFTNQQLDGELIDSINVNVGTTDVDSPTPSATGGTINYITRRPGEDFGLQARGSVGSFDYRRIFGLIDSGELGPIGTRAFGAASYTQYDKFKGPGELEKKQYNARLFQNFRETDFVSVAFHYNENRNNFYRNLNLQQFLVNDGLDNDKECRRLTPVAGTAQNENTGNTVVTSQDQVIRDTNCTSYHNLRINPSNTGNIRGQGRFDLGRGFQLTVDPYFQYVLANGGGFQAVSEGDGRLRGRTATSGADLNGDGDTLDTVTIYAPNTTNTRRYGATASLVWDITDSQRVRVSYTTDYGRHRQTGDYGFLDAGGNPEDVFGGKDGYGRKVLSADGVSLRGRDRFSIASLNQVSAQYRGEFLEDRLLIDLGVRAPYFKRELNQFCFSQVGSAFNVRCTTEAPTAMLANGNVQFGATGTTQFVPQYEQDFEYDDLLPTIQGSYEFIDNNRIFASFSQGFSAPRTDDLYTVARNADNSLNFLDVQPETTDNIDVGYRYSSPNLLAYATVFKNDFQNRIVTAFDPDLGFSVSRNVGAVEQYGAEFQITARIDDRLTLNAFGAYINAELQENTQGATLTGVVLTAGKKVVETPEYQFGMRADLDVTDDFSVGVQGKWVDSRFSNDLNTESAPDYTLWDLDARYDLTRFGYEDTYVQLNLKNLFDEKYVGNISTQGGSNLATFAVGAPFTAQLTLNLEF